MGIMVQDALNKDPLKKGILLAGENGVDRIIKSVNIIEVPEVVNWLKGGELLLTSGYVFKDDIKLRQRIIYDLAQKGVAALGIKPGQFFQEVPEDLIANSNELNLPLIEIPPQMPYSEIMIPLFELIINEQYYKLKRAQEIHEQLFELLLRGGNINSIAILLGHLIDNPVVIFDNCRNIRGMGCSEEIAAKIQDSLQNMKKHIWGFASKKKIHLHMDETHYNATIISIRIDDYELGYIFILEYNKPLNEQDLMAVHHAATITTLEFNKEKAVFDTEKKLGSELLEELLLNNTSNMTDIKRRATFLGFDLSQSKSVILINIIIKLEYSTKNEYYLDNLRNDIFKSIYNHLENYPGGSLLLNKGNMFPVLIGIEDRTLFEKKLQLIADSLAKNYGDKIDFSIGVGTECRDIKKIASSYEEAKIAARLSNYFQEKIIYYHNTGVAKLLFELKNTSILKRFYEDTVKILSDYDNKKKSDFVKTIETYFEKECNIRLTAETLYIHKNSVLYRLKRIEKLLNIDLKNSEDKLMLQVGLKIKHILESTSESEKK